MGRHTSRTLVLSCVAIGVTTVTVAHAQSDRFQRDCANWIEQKGYSTDYVEQRTGKRQPGLANGWRGNREVQDIEPGDVVLVTLRAANAKHAAVAEEIARDRSNRVVRVRVSEWNWGKTTDTRCLVTENFGKLARPRWIPAEEIAAVWHPE